MAELSNVVTADFQRCAERSLYAKSTSTRARQAAKPPLTIQQILAWAKAHFERTGKWPTCNSGSVIDAPSESWNSIDLALARGRRGLPGEQTLARLLAQAFGKRNNLARPKLSIEQILNWADAHHARTGRWPRHHSGSVHETMDESWSAIDAALKNGCRGLPSGRSLAQILAERRHVRNHLRLPRLTVKQILAWADAHFRRTGKWPTQNSGPVVAMHAKGEKWANIHQALHHGGRGLPGGSSLAQILIVHRGKRNRLDLPKLSIEQVLAWADAHHASTGGWPKCHSGAVRDAPQETWGGIESALQRGARGLSWHGSLAQLLTQYRGVPNKHRLPPITVEQILAWADEHFHQTGKWPVQNAGPISGASGQKWSDVDQFLRNGLRGLPGGSSLAKLLYQHRGRPTRSVLPQLGLEQILEWADAHHTRTGRWPCAASGVVTEAPQETWCAVNAALIHGGRGLAPSGSLAQLLAQHRQVRNKAQLPCLTEDQILAWADDHFRRSGNWPDTKSGAIPLTGGEKWINIDQALQKGLRGFPGGSSLCQLLAKYNRRRRARPGSPMEMSLQPAPLLTASRKRLSTKRLSARLFRSVAARRRRERREVLPLEKLLARRELLPIEQQELDRLIASALRGLNKRCRLILVHRFGLLGHRPKALQRIGQKLGLTRERVRQLQNKALRNLAKSSESKALRAYAEELTKRAARVEPSIPL